MFEQSFVEGRNKSPKKTSIVVSFLVQVAMVLTIIVLPLVFVDNLPAVAMTEVFKAPGPPTAPEPPPVELAAVRRTDVVPPLFNQGRLLEPARIPEQVGMIVDDGPLAPIGPSVIGGIGDRTGVRGSSFLDGIIGGTGPAAAPPPPKPAVPAGKPRDIERVRVGGKVGEPVLIHSVQPVYPALARQARIQGVVRLEAVIGAGGSVQALRATSGHPLLAPAALQAVQQWRYRPPTLNGNPIEVLMVVTVNFKLGQ